MKKRLLVISTNKLMLLSYKESNTVVIKLFFEYFYVNMIISLYNRD